MPAQARPGERLRAAPQPTAPNPKTPQSRAPTQKRPAAAEHPLLALHIRDTREAAKPQRPDSQADAEGMSTATHASTIHPGDSVSCVGQPREKDARPSDRRLLRTLTRLDRPAAPDRSDRRPPERPARDRMLADTSIEQLSMLTRQYLQRYDLL